MVVTEPMVSHALSSRTSTLSLIMAFMEYASAIMTASGRPSGTATTTMVMPMSRKERMAIAAPL